MKAACIEDYRVLARRRLPRFLFEYIDGGSYTETTMLKNMTDLADIQLRQRVLNDVSNIDLSVEVLGQSQAMPIMLGPVGLAGMNARRGEVQAAKAAQKSGIPFVLSTVSACSLSEVVESVYAPIWFQLYVMRDRDFMENLIGQAKASHCSALIFTVDMPVPGSRYRDIHSGLANASGFLGKARRVGQAMARPKWAWDVGLMGQPHTLGNVAPLLGENTGLEDFFAWMRNNFDPSIRWQDLAYIRDLWDGPLILKGIMDSDDACKAADFGADAIIVSNHGGRQLDGVQSTAEVLPGIKEAVADRLSVFVDGGVRSGLDVVKMMALGADSVLLGRAWAYALAANGQAGVEHMLSLLDAEMRVAMALTGVTRISDLSSEILV